jgi:pyruvate dehydrogenase (quinone)
LLGDGAMLMNGINTLVMGANRCKGWADPRFIVMVLNNGDLSEVTWEQRILEGEPNYASSQNVPDFPYENYAHSLGLGGIRVETPEAIATAWDATLSADRPVVPDMVTDANVPPLPPYLTVSQMRNYFAAPLRHDLDAIVKASAKEWWAGVSPETTDH